MCLTRILAACFAVAISLCSFDAEAQSQRRSAAPPAQKCLRALDGSCTNPDIAEVTRLRGTIISSVRVSYFGTPAGTVGGPFIPFERLFQDNEILFGLPTSSCIVCGGTVRSK
jgi:hypothetical protein